MSVEKITMTLLKHQVLSLAQLVVYVVFEEAMSTGNLTNTNLLLITELSEALMWRLCGPASRNSAAQGMFIWYYLLVNGIRTLDQVGYAAMCVQVRRNPSCIKTAPTWLSCCCADVM